MSFFFLAFLDQIYPLYVINFSKKILSRFSKKTKCIQQEQEKCIQKEHFIELRHGVQLTTEQFHEQIDAFNKALIDRIDEYENELIT